MTDTAALAAQADALRRLHVPGNPLVLPNAWDAASAKVVAEAGLPAVATSSGAIAAMAGHRDGEHMPPEVAFEAVRVISHAVDLPVTADLEAGYGLAADDFVARLLAAGAVGCNLEDTVHGSAPPRHLRDVDEQVAWISAVRAAATAAGVDVVINARTDAFLLAPGAVADPVAESIARGRAYLEAGADVVYPIVASAEADIAALVDGIPGPVNAFWRAGAPSLARLGGLGVARISFGGGVHRAAMDHVKGFVAEVAAGREPVA